jgi:hypothetical protein
MMGTLDTTNAPATQSEQDNTSSLDQGEQNAQMRAGMPGKPELEPGSGPGVSQAEYDATCQSRDDAQAKVSELTLRVDQLEGENQGLAAERDEMKAAAEKRANDPTSQPVEAPKRRDAKPMENPAPSTLLDCIRAAAEVHLIFSDGKRELAGLAPLRIDGDAWRVVVNGLALQLPSLTVNGPLMGQADLAGYGLFLDGKQAAWAGRPDVLTLHPGQQVNLTHDVIFAGQPA